MQSKRKIVNNQQNDNSILQKILENSSVGLFILIATIIGTSFTVIIKLDSTSESVKDIKREMKDMSGDIKDLQINMAVLNAKNNLKKKEVIEIK